MIIVDILNFILAGFLGYVVGRLSDYYLNFWLKDPGWAPHHWIYGCLLIAIALLFFRNSLELLIFAFGLGLFISDLEDFLSLKIIGSDKKDKNQRKFWRVD